MVLRLNMTCVKQYLKGFRSYMHLSINKLNNWDLIVILNITKNVSSDVHFVNALPKKLFFEENVIT